MPTEQTEEQTVILIMMKANMNFSLNVVEEPLNYIVDNQQLRRDSIHTEVGTETLFDHKDTNDFHEIIQTPDSVESQHCDENTASIDSDDEQLRDEPMQMEANSEGISVDQESNDFTASDEEPLSNFLNKYVQNNATDVEAEDGEVLFEVPIDAPFEIPSNILNELQNQNSNLMSSAETNEFHELPLVEHIVIAPATENDEMETSTVTNTKSKRSKKSQREETRNKRLKGELYTGYTRSKTGEIQHNEERNARTIKGRCMHEIPKKKTNRTMLCGLVSEPTREKLFNYFWSLPSWTARAAYLKGLVTTKEPGRRRKFTQNSQNRKKQSHDCFFPIDNGEKILVCRTMLLNSLDLGRNTFERWTRMSIEKCDQTIQEDENDQNVTNNQKDNNSLAKAKHSKANKRELLQWLQDLPKVPSHYCRSSSNKMYIESVFRSTIHIYKVYKNFCKENNTQFVSRTLFRKVLKAENIAIHKPRKDQCDLCCAYKTGNVSEEIYKDHLIKKTAAEEAKKKAKDSASQEKFVITMDLQSVLLAPKLEASAIYYKQKLQIHNFTVFELSSKIVDLYVWHECNGGVTANEFTSCIVDYIRKTHNENRYTHIVLISDGCGYQNRNKVLSSALLQLAQDLEITIEQLILERGHTMMEADSVHSSLESHFKPPLYAPSDYITRMRQARDHNPYKIHNLDFTFFLNYEKIPNNLKSIKPSITAKVTDIRGLLYLPTGELKYKLNHNDTWENLNLTRINTRNRQNTLKEMTPVQLYSRQIPISKSKYEQLQELKKVMERDYHPFYDSLPHK